MAWDFDGVDNYVKFAMPATLQVAPGGPMTMAALVNLDATTDGAFIHTMSGASSFQFLEVFSTYNYGTTAGARNGPSAAAAIGAWYYVIISKNTGNVAPEYTLIPLAAPGSPVSGTLTGGGVTLGDGTAPGASGFIQSGRWGTSSTEYVNGRIAAAGIWTAYLAQAAREALVTWALTLGSSGLRWAVRFDTISTLTDTIGGGNETARFGTAPITLVADPSGAFFASGSTVNAVMAATLPAPVATAAATVRHPAVLAATLPAPAATLIAKVRVPAVMAAALPAPAATMLATPRVRAVLAATLPSPAATMLATPKRLVLLSAILPAPVATLAATPRVHVTMSATLPAPVATIVKDSTPYVTAVLTPGAGAPATLTAGAAVPVTLTPSAISAATLTPSTA